MSQTTFSRGVSDSLKGVMQLGILFSHLSYTSAEPALIFTLANKLGTSIIALYFFISGYGLMQAIKSGKGVGKLSQRLWGIFKPMLLTTLLFLLFLMADGEGYDALWLSRLIDTGQTPLPNTWFIFILMWLYSSFWVVFRYLDKQQQRIWALSLLLLLSLLSMAWCQTHGYERAWWVTTLAFFSGTVYAEYESYLYPRINRIWVIGLCLAFVGLLVWANIEYLLPLAYLVIPIVAITWINRLGYATWIERTQKHDHDTSRSLRPHLDTMLRSVLNYLAKISYELYLVHGALIVVFRSHNIYIHSNYGYALAVILGSILTADLLHRLLHLRLAHK